MQNYSELSNIFNLLPMPYEYYKKLAYCAFEYAENLNFPLKIINHYADFIGIFPTLNKKK